MKIVQRAPANSDFPQLVVFVKNCGEVVMPFIVRMPDPVLVRMIFCAALFVPPSEAQN